MSNVDAFITVLKKDKKKGISPTLLEKQAWAWYDTLALPPNAMGAARAKIMKVLDLVDEEPEPEARFTDLLGAKKYPQTGWLADYVRFAAEFCGAPNAFHFFSAAACLGCSLKRDAWLQFGHNDVYGAMYVVLIAPPGLCYKSTSINIATAMLRDMDLLPIIAGRATPEGLSDILSTLPEDNPHDAIAMISASELYRFLAGHNTPANNQIISALTSWYDAAKIDDDITVTRSKRILHNIAISLLGGTTLEWLVESLPKHVFAGGFMSRVIFVAQEHPQTIKSWAPPEDPLKRMKLLEDWRDILKDFKGPMELSKPAFVFYDQWFHAQYEKLKRAEDRVADFYQRRSDHVRKMALVLAASHGHTRIEVMDIEWATKLLEMLDPSLNAIITPISLGDAGHDLDIIRRTVEKYKTISRTDMVRKCSARGIDVERMQRLMETLKASALVEDVTIGKRGGKGYKWLK